jgi:hypothetical protein
MLASLLFPYDEDAPNLIEGWLVELEREECIKRYQVESKSYVQVCNWLIQQKIDKPSKSRIPQFVEPSRKVSSPRERSSEDLRTKEGTKDQGGEGEESEAPPFPASDIPEGLPALTYARGLLEHCNIPNVIATQQAVAAAIGAYAREMSIPKHLATQGLIELARDALAHDEPVDKWWFTDRKWIRKKGNNGHFTTKADITLNAARELIDEIRGAAGGVENQGADLPGDSTAGGCIEGNPQAVRRRADGL